VGFWCSDSAQTRDNPGRLGSTLSVPKSVGKVSGKGSDPLFSGGFGLKRRKFGQKVEIGVSDNVLIRG
jgi:hypothetical protein